MLFSNAWTTFRLGASLLLAAGIAISCSLAIDANSLGDGCPEGEKLCAAGCVTKTDPELGCGRSTCQPCALPKASSVCGPSGDCLVASCSGSFEDCNGSSLDGCEVDINSDPQHCGSCSATPCALANAQQDCASGHCAILRCVTGFKDCDHRVDNGCEVVLATDRNNCGDCGVICAAGQTCSSGICS